MRQWHKLKNRDLVNDTGPIADCSICGPVPLVRTHPATSGWHGFQCAISYWLSKEADWRRRGLTLTAEQFGEKLQEQNNLCAICNKPLVKPCADHDHGSGDFRGILCNGCNRGLGFFEDNPELLQAAIAYLARSRNN